MIFSSTAMFAVSKVGRYPKYARKGSKICGLIFKRTMFGTVGSFDRGKIAGGLHEKRLDSTQKQITTRSYTSLKLAETADFDMFCRQCEQAKNGVGCTSVGVCGKSSESTAVQDTLMQLVKCVSTHCTAGRQVGASVEDLEEANLWTLEATFSTLTNVNFSEQDIVDLVKEGIVLKAKMKSLINDKGGTTPADSCASLDVSMSLDEFEDFGRIIAGVLPREVRMGDENSFSLNEIATAGAKGASAYAAHSAALGFMDEDNIMKPLHEIWSTLESDKADVDGLLQTVLEVGKINTLVLAKLDEAHATTFGVPEPTKVRSTAIKGKAVLVSGHDIKDLYLLLKQTKGTGINVYTHGEMLPGHMYPSLNAFTHLAGNYGTAWQKQKTEFSSFPGPILVTSNCILHPRRIYKERIYTTNEVGVDGVQHIGKDKDFSKLIKDAMAMKGFESTVEPTRFKTVGFNHRYLLPMVKDIVNSIQSGDLSHIFVIGGCDGSEWDRNYFTELAESSPSDSIILTMGCAKNRVINSEKLMDAKLPNGLPRIMDLGQCNDSYSAIVLVQALAKELNCGINDVPVSLALSHLEQKAAAVLLSLLHLGVKNIRLGPTLPAYVSPGILAVLQHQYGLTGTGVVEEDMKAMLEEKK